MSETLSVIGKVAGIAAMIPGPHQPIAAAIAAVATIGAALTAKTPPPKGGSSEIKIGADMPTPFILGLCYSGGSRVYQRGYGEEDDVPNAHAFLVDVYSRGAKREAMLGAYADFTEVAFDGTDAPHVEGEAVGFYDTNMHRMYQLGESPESAALEDRWDNAPSWGSSYKLSGFAAIGYSLRWENAEDTPYQSGVPQFGALWGPPYLYDARLDSTYPGGSGSQRWADPADQAAFSTAKATWNVATRNPGVQGLNYVLGMWERNEADAGAEYTKVMGWGAPWDSIIVADFVELANVCDENGWNCDGVIYEPGEGLKWSNLKDILAAGGAEPVFKGGRLGCRIRAPRISVVTVTKDDIADGEITPSACLPWKDRVNSIQSKYKSSAHRWEYVPGAVVTSSSLVTLDKGIKRDTIQWNCVTDATQAAQLTGYELADRREQTLELTLQQHMRDYWPGELVTLDAEMLEMTGLTIEDWEIRRRRFDPVTMTVRWTLVSETDGKHDFALGQTGTTPPDIDIWTPGEVYVPPTVPQVTDLEVEPGVTEADITFRLPLIAGWSYVRLLRSDTSSIGGATSIAGDIVDGLGVVMSFNDDSLTPDDYWWWVRVYDSGGNVLSTTDPVTGTVT